MPDFAADVVLAMPIMDGQYNVHTSSGTDLIWPGTNDGLFVGDDSWIAILCGTTWGLITLGLRYRKAPPAEAATEWEMVAEWSLNCVHGTLIFQALYSTELTKIVEVPPGWIRLRVMVRNRMAGAEAAEGNTDPVEEHRVEYWATEGHQEPAILRGPDAYGIRYLGPNN